MLFPTQYGHRVFVHIDYTTRELKFVFRNQGKASQAKNNLSLNIHPFRWGQGAGGREQPFRWGEVLHPNVPNIKPLENHESTLQVTFPNILSSDNCQLFNIWPFLRDFHIVALC